MIGCLVAVAVARIAARLPGILTVAAISVTDAAMPIAIIGITQVITSSSKPSPVTAAADGAVLTSGVLFLPPPAPCQGPRGASAAVRGVVHAWGWGETQEGTTVGGKGPLSLTLLMTGGPAAFVIMTVVVVTMIDAMMMSNLLPGPRPLASGIQSKNLADPAGSPLQFFPVPAVRGVQVPALTCDPPVAAPWVPAAVDVSLARELLAHACAQAPGRWSAANGAV